MEADPIPDFPGYRLDAPVASAGRATGAGGHGGRGHGAAPSPERARVWRATRLADDRIVAVKVFPAGQADLARREAALQATIDHPHLLRLLDVVGADGRVGLVTGYAAGGSLAGLLARRGRLTWQEALTVLIPLADVLAAADERELVHGDVSPANVLFDTAGRPVLADLGAARAAAELSLPVAVTPTDVSPEVARGAAPDHRSDLFSLGSVALQCLSGQPAWPADTVTDALIQSTLGQWPDPESVIAPADLVAIVRRLLDPEPGRRGSAAAVAVDLRRVGEPAAVDLSEWTADGQPRLPATQVRPDAAALRAALATSRRQRFALWATLRPWHRRTAGGPSKAVGRHAAGAGRLGGQGPGGRRFAGGSSGTGSQAHRFPGSRIRNAAFSVLVVLALGAGAVTVGLWWAGSDRVDPPDVASLPPGSLHQAPAASVATSGISAAPSPSDSTVPTGPAALTAPKGPMNQADWAAVVAGLDANRARALTEQDPDRLDLVYTPGSLARAADVATIRQLQAAGYRLAGAGHTITSVVLLSDDSDATTTGPVPTGDAGDPATVTDAAALRVVESMPQVMIMGDDGRPLGHTKGSAASTVVLVLIRTDDGFRIRSVQPG